MLNRLICIVCFGIVIQLLIIDKCIAQTPIQKSKNGCKCGVGCDCALSGICDCQGARNKGGCICKQCQCERTSIQNKINEVEVKITCFGYRQQELMKIQGQNDAILAEQRAIRTEIASLRVIVEALRQQQLTPVPPMTPAPIVTPPTTPSPPIIVYPQSPIVVPPGNSPRYDINPGGTPRYEVNPGGTPRYDINPGGTPRYELPPSGTPQYTPLPGGTPRYQVPTKPVNPMPQPPTGVESISNESEGVDGYIRFSLYRPNQVSRPQYKQIR